jgi:hypothetical protein
MQHIETFNPQTPPPEQVFARAIQAQVKAWMAAKPNRRSTTDDSIPVVRRRRPKAVNRGSQGCRIMSIRGRASAPSRIIVESAREALAKYAK